MSRKVELRKISIPAQAINALLEDRYPGLTYDQIISLIEAKTPVSQPINNQETQISGISPRRVLDKSLRHHFTEEEESDLLGG